ncbi:hypothetical protein DH86_00003642, partial [Scytalidium sp. 3C]
KALESVILDPKNAEYLAILKAARNGAVYGTKVRFPHALVMIFLFRSGTVREKLQLIFRATRTHAKNLAKYAAIYKTAMLFLKHYGGTPGKEVFARVCLSIAQLLVKPQTGIIKSTELSKRISHDAWPVFAALSWGSVMWLFRWYPETVQSGLKSSMDYIYVDSDHWDSLRNFLWVNK